MKGISTRLSKAAIDNMQPNTKIIDTATPGLQVWAGAKTKTFYLVKHADGRWTQMKIGRWPDMTITEARAIVLEKLGALANHLDIDAPSARRDPTLGDAMDYYLQEAKSDYFQRDTGYCFKHFIHLREKRIIDVTEDDIRDVFDSLEGEAGGFVHF